MKRPKMSSMHALKVRVVPCEIVMSLPKRKGDFVQLDQLIQKIRG